MPRFADVPSLAAASGGRSGAREGVDEHGPGGVFNALIGFLTLSYACVFHLTELCFVVMVEGLADSPPPAR